GVEQHTEWIGACLTYLRDHGYRTIEPTLEAQDAWVEHVNEVAKGTMYTAATCNSWYLGANIPGKPRVFLPYVGGLPASIEQLRANDQDPDVRVSIIRGAGPSFSAGYDLAGGNTGYELPFYTPAGEGQWPRHVTEGWMSIWDLAKPVIAQVHGYCLAGGSELATCCDLVYVAEDAQMGYPAVRFGVPDMHFHP